ncbi:MAG TPA: cytochrome c3 family protein [Anaeromyxobacteraceae bacterium]|nr:cytochrome c3 family protein [Anaeromyxobacteraceae bacterium]
MGLHVFTATRARSLLLAASLGAPALAAGMSDADCLGCHGREAGQLELADGGRVALSVDEAALRASVHGGAAGCTDCHADKVDYPHRAGGPPTRQALVRDATASCANCHDAPAAEYARGGHGRRFASGDPDAPACSDCHGSHAIGRAASLALEGAEACVRCHGDAARMKRHGLDADVVSTWRQDFHGMAATLQRKHGIAPGGRRAATCVDCHGAHGALPKSDPASPVAPANQLATCRRCHPDADARFPAAFLGHRPPTWQSAAIVRGVQLFYRAMIPFMVVGLVLQILLHVWRMAVKR